MRTLAFVGSLSCAVLQVAACDAGAKPVPTPTTAKLIEPTPPARPAEADVGADLTYLPAESDIVIHIDVMALARGKLWPTYAGDAVRLIAPAFAGCEHEPVSHATTIDMGLRLAPAEASVEVFHGLDRDKTLACLNGKQSVSRDGAFITLAGFGVLTFVDDHTMVMLRSTTATKNGLQQVIQSAADAPLRKNEAFVAAARKVKKPAAITFVSRPGSEPLASRMSQAGMQVSVLYQRSSRS